MTEVSFCNKSCGQQVPSDTEAMQGLSPRVWRAGLRRARLWHLGSCWPWRPKYHTRVQNTSIPQRQWHLPIKLSRANWMGDLEPCKHWRLIMGDCRCYTGVVLRTEGLAGSASPLEMASAARPYGEQLLRADGVSLRRQFIREKKIQGGALTKPSAQKEAATHAHVVIIEVIVVIHPALVHPSSAAASTAAPAHPFASTSRTPATAST